VHGVTCGDYVSDLVVGIGIHGWGGQEVAGSNLAVPTRVNRPLLGAADAVQRDLELADD
jgi:hypothetical protein